MNRLKLTYLSLMLMPLTAAAALPDSALVEHTALPRLLTADTELNPALHGAAYRYSYSQLAAGIDLQRQTEAFVQQMGSGYTLPYAQVNTFLRLSAKTAVWGAASYTTGNRQDVKWNSTSDYTLLEPYVLADTLGGDTRQERYCFAGGYATQTGRWMLGAEMLFRAEQEYRNRDPRMRGVVTDLTMRLGAGRQTDRYRLGAAAEANVYRQTNSVTFYSEEGVIPEYQMTGLGTEYSRFSGDKRSLYYDGGGVGCMLSAVPADGRGFYAHLVADEHRYHRKLAEYNSMPLTDLYNEHAGMTAGWRGSRWAAFAHGGYTRRTGDEHIGGTSDARYFPTIGTLSMYKHRQKEASAGALYNHSELTLMVCGGYKSSSEEYAYPGRQMDYSSIRGELKGQYLLHAGRPLMLQVNALLAYEGNVGGKILMPYANMTASFSQMVNHRYDYATANYTHASASLRADYRRRDSSYGYFAQIGGSMVFCSIGENQTTLQGMIGITF